MPLILGMESEENVIYVHSDMLQERSMRSNYHIPSVTRAYREFDKVAVVRDGLKGIIAQGFNISPDKISVVHNINRIDPIRNLALQDVHYDAQTSPNMPIEELKAILEDDNASAAEKVQALKDLEAAKELLSLAGGSGSGDDQQTPGGGSTPGASPTGSGSGSRTGGDKAVQTGDTSNAALWAAAAALAGAALVTAGKKRRTEK